MPYYIRNKNINDGMDPPASSSTSTSNVYYIGDTIALESSSEPMEHCKNGSGISHIRSGYNILNEDILKYNAGVKEEYLLTTTSTVPTYAYYVSALLIGGGGGGGGGGKGDKNNNGASGGGGGGGGCSIMRLFPVTPGVSYTVTIGSGGSAGIRQWDGGSASGAGGNTVFSYNGTPTLTAHGGSGGSVGSGANVGAAGGSGGLGNHYDDINNSHVTAKYTTIYSAKGGNGVARDDTALGGTVTKQSGTTLSIGTYGKGGDAGIGGNRSGYKTGGHGSPGNAGYCVLYWFGGLPS